VAIAEAPQGFLAPLGTPTRHAENIGMAVLKLLSVAAAIEAATGIALIIVPQAVASLLLGADLAGAGIAVARVAGIALLSLGLLCWMSRQNPSKTAVLTAMLCYNLLVTAYLTYLGFGGSLVGILLWPAVGIHAVLTIGFAYAETSELKS
jgi:hypothetical protein